jgi:hypothetical protein
MEASFYTHNSSYCPIALALPSPVYTLVFQVFVDGLFDYEGLKVISLTIDLAMDMPNVAFRTIAWKL